ncbi:MAG: hypothetical protein KY475_20245 [Planctomycetes bacterium]|nr:hypothetical protein [Planctomycetota bacterium]
MSHKPLETTTRLTSTEAAPSNAASLRDNLADHNLVTFKSHHQPLDPWAIKEHVGHSVNYRKMISPSLDQLVPEDMIRLYAVCARFPQNLGDVVQLSGSG